MTVSLFNEDREEFASAEPELTSDDLRAAQSFLGTYNPGAVPQHSHLMFVTQREGHGERLLTTLRRAGFAITTTTNPARESIDWTGWHADIVLIDAPGNDDRAIDVCRIVRKRTDEPIVLLRRPAECDAVLDLAFDTDFYDSRSAEFLGVASCLHTLLRESPHRALPRRTPNVETGDLRLDPDGLLLWSGVKAVTLAPQEFELMRLLLENAGRIVSRTTILSDVWGRDVVRDKSIVSVHIRRLRMKLAELDSRGHIAVVRGVGYRYEIDSGSSRNERD